MSQDTNDSNSKPDSMQVIKDALLWQVNEYFYPDVDLGKKQVKFQEYADWTSISVTPDGLNFTTGTIPKFDRAIHPLGYRFNGIWCGYNLNRLMFVLSVVKED